MLYQEICVKYKSRKLYVVILLLIGPLKTKLFPPKKITQKDHICPRFYVKHI